jgi:hypothetical protein
VVIVSNRRRLLYYFTPLAGLEKLIASERLPADSPIPRSWPARLVRKPVSVVWLSDLGELTPEQAAGEAMVRPGLTATAATLARITVSVPDAQYWSRWAEWHAISRRWQEQLDGDADGLSGRWWVVSRPIPASQWVKVEPRRAAQPANAPA